MPSCEKFTRPRDLWERRWGDLRRIASWRAEALCCFLETSYFFTFSVYKTRNVFQRSWSVQGTRHAYQC